MVVLKLELYICSGRGCRCGGGARLRIMDRSSIVNRGWNGLENRFELGNDDCRRDGDRVGLGDY